MGELRYRFIIETVPGSPEQQKLVEDFYLELRKQHRDWDILGTAGFFRRDGKWIAGGGYAVSGDFDEADDEYAVIATVDAAVIKAMKAAQALHAADALSTAAVIWPEMSITAFALGRPDSKVKRKH